MVGGAHHQSRRCEQAQSANWSDGQGGRRVMTKSKHTVSELIVNSTPPNIFKQRARLIKLITEASVALNEHMKVTDDPDFLYSFDSDDKRGAALSKAFFDREQLEYELARQINNLIYYDQEEWVEYEC